MKEEITVTVGYYDFTFEDVNEAINFARTAVKAKEKDSHVSLEIRFIEEEVEEDE